MAEFSQKNFSLQLVHSIVLNRGIPLLLANLHFYHFDFEADEMFY